MLARASVTLIFLLSVLALSAPQPSDATHFGAAGKIAFHSLRGDAADIFAIDPDGTGEVDLTPLGDTGGYSPAWSPDGSRIAFGGYRQGRSGLYVMNADGSQMTRLVTWPVYSLDWSPDGTRLAVSRVDPSSGTSRIYTMNADGTTRVALPQANVLDENPSWSPEGNTIAFDSYDPAVPYLDAKIYITDPEGSGGLQVIADGADPSWSPDGRKIAFDSNPRGSGVWVMSQDGSDQVLLESHPDAVDGAPAWSPDGGHIAFTSDDYNHSYVLVMAADGSDLVQVTTSGQDYRPDWQPVCTVLGTAGNDRLVGTSHRDLMCGLGGNDTIYALDGNDVIFAAAGDDRVDGGFGQDVISGGSGADFLYGGPGPDLISSVDSVEGNDHIQGAGGFDLCLADSADRVIGCP